MSLQFDCKKVLSIAKGVTIKTVPQNCSCTDDIVNFSRTNLTHSKVCQSSSGMQLLSDKNRTMDHACVYDINMSWSLLWSSFSIECDMGNFTVSSNQSDSAKTDNKLVVKVVSGIVGSLVVLGIIILGAIIAFICYQYRLWHRLMTCLSSSYQQISGSYLNNDHLYTLLTTCTVIIIIILLLMQEQTLNKSY